MLAPLPGVVTMDPGQDMLAGRGRMVPMFAGVLLCEPNQIILGLGTQHSAATMAGQLNDIASC